MKWTKPNGTVIKTNDMKETIEYCKSLGWKDFEIKAGIKLPQSGTGPVVTNMAGGKIPGTGHASEPLAGEEPVVRRRGKSILRPTVGTNKKES